MKLSESFTYPSLEGVSLRGSILCSLPRYSGFNGRAGSEVSLVCVFPRVSQQSLLWWELEGLEAELGVSQGFFYPQWLSLPYQE